MNNRKKQKQITRIVNTLLKSLPKPGTPEYQQLLEEIPQLSSTNCWCHEYGLARYLTESGYFSDCFGRLRVKP